MLNKHQHTQIPLHYTHTPKKPTTETLLAENTETVEAFVIARAEASSVAKSYFVLYCYQPPLKQARLTVNWRKLLLQPQMLQGFVTPAPVT